MTLVAVVLVLAGAITHAAWNLAAKGGSSSGPIFVWLAAVISAVALAPVAGAFLLTRPPDLGLLVLGGAVSGAVHTTYFLLLQKGYRSGDVSIVYPLARGTGPLLTVLIAVIAFGERPGRVPLGGALLIILGVVIISLAGSRGVELRPAAVGFGLGTGVAIAAYTLWDAHGVNGLGLDPVLLMWGSSLVQALLLTPIAARFSAGLLAPARQLLRQSLRPVLLVGIGSPLAYVLILYAVRLAPVSLVAPGRESSVVLVSLAGWLWLKEPNPRPRLLGAAVVLIGIVLLAVG